MKVGDKVIFINGENFMELTREKAISVLNEIKKESVFFFKLYVTIL